MSYLNQYAPTWRLCHPVNIYVFKNGVASDKPQLVHIPMEKKKNMTSVFDAIQSRMKLMVGYPIGLYDMDGIRICKTYELQNYSYYVVVTNIEKKFKCADYGRYKEPLVVIGHHSKHVNTLRMQNTRFDLFCRRKFRRPLHEMIPHGEQNGLGPSELPPQGPPCGTLCTKIPPALMAKPTQVCSDEIMCVEGTNRGSHKKRVVGTTRGPNERGVVGTNMGPNERGVGDECVLPAHCQRGGNKNCMGEIEEYMRKQGQNSTGKEGQLMDLILRYQHVGSDIFKMFQDRVNNDLESNRGKLESQFNLPAGNGGSLLKIQEELKKLAQASCQLVVDKTGKFIGTQGCPVNLGDDIVAEARMAGAGGEGDSNVFIGGKSEGGVGIPFSNYKAKDEALQGGSALVAKNIPAANLIENSQLHGSSTSIMPASSMGTTEPPSLVHATTSHHDQLEMTDVQGNGNAPNNNSTHVPTQQMEMKEIVAAAAESMTSSVMESPQPPSDDNLLTFGNQAHAMMCFGNDFRNPWLEGDMPFTFKRSKKKTDCSDPPSHRGSSTFRKHWFHGEQRSKGETQHDDDDRFIEGILPPEGYDVVNNNRQKVNFLPPKIESSSSGWFPPTKGYLNTDRKPPTPLPDLTHSNDRASYKDSSATFTIHKYSSSISLCRGVLVDRGCGGSRIFQPHLDDGPVPRSESSIQNREVKEEIETVSPRILPSEDEFPIMDVIEEKPAGMYQGYQESIKVKSSCDKVTEFDCSSDDEGWERQKYEQERRHRREKYEQERRHRRVKYELSRRQKRERPISCVPSEFDNNSNNAPTIPSSHRHHQSTQATKVASLEVHTQTQQHPDVQRSRAPVQQQPSIFIQASPRVGGSRNSPSLPVFKSHPQVQPLRPDPQKHEVQPLGGTILLTGLPFGSNVVNPNTNLTHVPFMNRIAQPPPTPAIALPTSAILSTGYQPIIMGGPPQHQQPFQNVAAHISTPLALPPHISVGGSSPQLIRIPIMTAPGSSPTGGMGLAFANSVLGGHHGPFSAPVNVINHPGKLVRFAPFQFPTPGSQYFYR